jgi:hypothetical protein
MKLIAILGSVIKFTMSRYSLLVVLVVISASASIAQRISIIPKAGVALSSVRNHPGILDSPVPVMESYTIATAGGYSTVQVPSSAPPTDDNFVEADDQHTPLKAGFTVGAAINIAFSDYFSIQPEINFVQKGVSVRYSTQYEVQLPGLNGNPAQNDDERFWGNGKMTVYYLEMPVLAKYTFPGKTSWARFFVVAGPSVSLGLGGKVKSENHSRAVSNPLNDGQLGTGNFIVSESNYKRDGSVIFEQGTYADNGSDQVINKRVTFGAQIGGGAVLFDRFSVDIRYGTDFTSLYDRYSNAYNQTFQATVGFPLALN